MDRRPRILPAIVIAAAYWIATTAIRLIVPGTYTHFLAIFWGPILIAVGWLGWLLFFSRLSWRERFVSAAAMIAGGLVIWPLTHPSLKLGILMIALPWVLTAAVVWQFAARRQTAAWRTRGFVVVAPAFWFLFVAVRVDGLGGDLATELSWRWTTTPEERFLAERNAATVAVSSTIGPLRVEPGDWPEFRGPRRDGRTTGVQIETDWRAEPPTQLWKKRVGPGWSSFAVVGDYAFTQEQRGDDEATVCYRVATGEELWDHLEKGRFWEVVAGAGPRATPTFRDGKVYALGAEGVLTCLDAASGRLLWRRDAKADAGADTPMWGFAASPLLVDDKAVVVIGGPDAKGVVAYRAADGTPAWFGGQAKYSYSSAQRAVIDGVEQILVMSDVGLESLAPADGRTLWTHEWRIHEGAARVLQPFATDDGRIVLATGYGEGTRSIKPTRNADGSWQTAIAWTSKKFNPYYNDFVVHQGHAYGFDGNIFACVDLSDGERRWKKGRYGYGQTLLLAEQRLLLVLSDVGEAVLVAAEPTELRELGRFQAIAGKTWNHPVVVGDKLLVRNGEEAACWRLPRRE